MLENELQKSRQIESDLIELVHSIYVKIEELKTKLPENERQVNDKELRRINRTLREILSQRKLDDQKNGPNTFKHPV